MSALLMPNEDSQVKELSQQVSGIEASAKELQITDDDGMRKATDILGYIAGIKKNMEDRRKFFVQPLNDQVKRVNEWFKQQVSPLDAADSTLRGKVLSFRQEQERKRREEEERLRKLAEKEQRKLEKQAEKTGAFVPPSMPVPTIQQQAKTVESEMGSVSAKTVWDFQITDEKKIPREFLMVNEKAIRAAVKAGVRNIAGVNIYQTETLAVSSRRY